ncbi:cucumber peeling cupredoxin-like [Magnolia sinica]|uniref:cucumber peeling cupredoxin-like n=1 Tax=Magnolia sinica TaxID=86752 RepID=UPI0026587012|nr:cucumber peeling cupredoxin-like [Magnolia sinica]
MASSSSSSSFMGLIIVVVAAALLQCTAAATYTVGDTTGWTIPSGGAQFYPNWAGGKTFVVGDILSFNFSPQGHDVATVTKAQYDACTAPSEGNIIRTSPANITLSTAGNHYYICTFSGHCSAGQKLTINVVSSSTATPTTPTTPPTVSAGGPSPPPTSGDSTPPNAAPSLAAGFRTAGVVAAVFTAFFL